MEHKRLPRKLKKKIQSTLNKLNVNWTSNEYYTPLTSLLITGSFKFKYGEIQDLDIYEPYRLKDGE